MKPANSEQLYRDRMARVVALLVADPMAQHRLEDLAAAAAFSPFHFHRLYHSLMGETVTETLRRLRLAQASSYLSQGRGSVTEIALACGYDSPQAFSRAFQRFAGHSPRAFQRRIAELGDHQAGSPMVELKEVGPLQLQGLQHHGPTATIPHTHRHLRRLVGPHAVSQWLGLCQGDPAEEDFRYFAATRLASGKLEDARLQAIELPAGLYASHTLFGPYSQINATIEALYASWLPGSGFEPDHRPLLEFYHPHAHDAAPSDRRTDLLIPVRPLQ
ncbi:GyrI-like domain-containing protein [Herbaspirillum sp. NPDC087042]|uniref:AraC family transcriptional regulator n=1 Tax=Herbaspirillum sp. NPDC087042 TaxID=3364004 RepID=UPI0038180E44